MTGQLARTFWRVMTTPQGTGAPMNLCPDTETDPMGFLKDTLGAFLTKGICVQNWDCQLLFRSHDPSQHDIAFAERPGRSSWLADKFKLIHVTVL